ncbi:uncharacterized protein LOC111600545 [Drosophila hydei]|uniref:Malate dehydrogenase n=1 Tax=Drosophila hydei TaxID=7224 RepID=A0A6J2T0S1_DROHY|nr:uncharacterized protein LOC111600545 [Drosophila hydei]
MLTLKLLKHIPAVSRSSQQELSSWNLSITRGVKVAVVGAAGGIGQPLSLLLKLNPLITELSLHDKSDTKGIAADLSHICTASTVRAFNGDTELVCALESASIVVVPAGMPRKPGMDRSELLDVNANVASTVARAVSNVCPSALLAFITNPVNAIVPIVAEVLKQEDAYDPKRLFGVTTLDVVRAKTFIGALLNVDPDTVRVPVIGGHAGQTILPLLSQCEPELRLDADKKAELVSRIQEAGTEVVKAKAGKGSATLSMAYSASRFVNSLLRAINNEEDIIECAYVQSTLSEAEFFASPVLLGPAGIKKNLELPPLDEDEEERLDSLIVQLNKEITDGVKLVAC